MGEIKALIGILQDRYMVYLMIVPLSQSMSKAKSKRSNSHPREWRSSVWNAYAEATWRCAYRKDKKAPWAGNYYEEWGVDSTMSLSINDE